MCTAEHGKKTVLQPWCRVTCPCTAGASLVTAGSQARSKGWKAEPHSGLAVGNEGYGQH
jgi:hypothetical protein